MQHLLLLLLLYAVPLQQLRAGPCGINLSKGK
jgi:hypothetical protein